MSRELSIHTVKNARMSISMEYIQGVPEKP